MLTDTRHTKLSAQRIRQPPRAVCDTQVGTCKDVAGVPATVTLRFAHGVSLDIRYGIAYEMSPKEARQLALTLAEYASRADRLDGKGIGIGRPHV